MSEPIKNEDGSVTFTCSDCPNERTLTPDEVAFYESKGLHLPRRCKECIAKRKKQ